MEEGKTEYLITKKNDIKIWPVASLTEKFSLGDAVIVVDFREEPLASSHISLSPLNSFFYFFIFYESPLYDSGF